MKLSDILTSQARKPAKRRTKAPSVPFEYAAEQCAFPNDMIVACLPFPPSVNHLYAQFRGRRILSAKGRAYKAGVAAFLTKVGIRQISGDVECIIHLHRPRKDGDVDGRFKILLDSLTGIAYRDDAQVKRIIAERFEDPANPRVVIVVRPMSGEKGIAP